MSDSEKCEKCGSSVMIMHHCYTGPDVNKKTQELLKELRENHRFFSDGIDEPLIRAAFGNIAADSDYYGYQRGVRVSYEKYSKREKRERLASMTLQGLCASGLAGTVGAERETGPLVAKASVQLADALIATLDEAEENQMELLSVALDHAVILIGEMAKNAGLPSVTPEEHRETLLDSAREHLKKTLSEP